MGVLRDDGVPSCCVDDRFIYKRLDPFGKQYPLVFRQILQYERFFVSGGVGIQQRRVKQSGSERRGRDPAIPGAAP